MDSTADTKQTDPHDVSPGLSTQETELIACADERLAHAYEQIARADEQLARVNEQDSKARARCRAPFFSWTQEAREQVSSAIAWQAGATRLYSACC